MLGSPVASPAAYAARVGVLVESPAFLPGLSARTNLVSLARLRRLPLARVDAVLVQVGLVGRDREPVGRFSLGMKQRLGIAAALLPDPELLILDEPTNGLDPAGIVEIRELLRGLGRDGRTVIVSSHQLSEIEAVCDYLVVIRFGELVFAGPMTQMMRRTREHINITAEHPADTGTPRGCARRRRLVRLGRRRHPAGRRGRVTGCRPQPGGDGCRRDAQPAGRRTGQPRGDLPGDDRTAGRRAGERPRGNGREDGA